MNRSLQLAQKQKAPPLPREYPQVRCGELPLQLQGLHGGALRLYLRLDNSRDPGNDPE